MLTKFYFLIYLDFKQISLAYNFEALINDACMRNKVDTLRALFFARSKGGSESLEDFFTYVRKKLNSAENIQQYQGVANSTLLCTLDSVLDLIKKEPVMLKQTIKELLESSQPLSQGALFNQELEGFYTDLKYAKLRSVLIRIIESESTDAELRELSVKLMLRLGKIMDSGEDLLRAALYQKHYKINVISELEFFCG